MPACEVSDSCQATASSVTSPFDQVTASVSGRVGAPPAHTASTTGVSADTMVAGSTVTVEATFSPVASTVPLTSNVPPSRLATTAACPSVRASHVTGSSLTAPPDHTTSAVWGSSTTPPLATPTSKDAPSATFSGTATRVVWALASTDPSTTTSTVASPLAKPSCACSAPSRTSPTTWPSCTTWTVAPSRMAAESMATPMSLLTALPESDVEARRPSSTSWPAVHVSGTSSTRLRYSRRTFTPW